MNTTLLVIDDSEDDQLLYQLAFRDFDSFINLVMASSAEAGFALVAEVKPDLILLDYNLPGMDGLSFTKKLSAYSDSPIPIIMLTGQDNAAIAVDAMKNGVDDYMVKDIEGRYLKLLPGVVGHVMAAHAQREQTRRLQQETDALLRRNQILMQNSKDGIHIMDMQGNLVEANDAFCNMLGYSKEEMAHLNVADWDMKWSAEELRERFKDHIINSARFETVHCRKDGKLIDVEIGTSSIEIEGRFYIFASSHDITERKRSEEDMLLERAVERRHAEKLAQQFGHLLQSSFNEIYMFDAHSLKFILTSQGAEKNLGYTEDELNQLTPLDLKPSHTRASFESLIAPLRSGEQQLLLFETVHRRKDGSTYPVEVRLQLMEGDSPVFLAIVQDITERSRAEKQLREFTAHLQTVREEEKASIAREVHDDLGGTLAALKMDAYWLAGKLVEKNELQPLYQCAQAMVGLLNNAVLATRRIITDLRPTILDELGLMAALKWQCAEFQKRTGIKCQCACIENESFENRLDKLQLINLFRIFQEALTNVVRHSGASKVIIDLHQSGEKIILMIQDDGCGLPKGHTIPATSYGMRGMRERVAQLGGKIKFDTPPQGGFCVTVKLPLLHGSIKTKSNHANNNKQHDEE